MTTPYPDHAQLRGNYAPIRMECDIDDVIVRGELPGDLDITYYRNGPDPQFPPRRDHHWFAGDGMLHMFHVQNGRIRYRNRWVPTVPPRARLTEWIVDLAANANRVQRRALDDTAGEFPRLDERFAGTTYRHGYYAATANGSTDLTFNTIVRHDFRGGRHVRYALPDGDTTGEPVFVPRSRDAAEGDGYLLSVVHRGRENRSDLAFFDAENLADGPIACAELPHRVPYGFHGNWKYNDES